MVQLVCLMVGLVFGVALGGWWIAAGAVLGLAVGALLERSPASEAAPKLQSARARERHAREAFARGLCSLFVRVAEVDGEMTREEAAAIRDFFQDNLGCDAEELDQVRLELKAARANPQALDKACAAARESMGEADLSLLYYALWRVAAADRSVSRSEEQLLGKIARALRLDPDIAAAMSGAPPPEYQAPEEAEAEVEAPPPPPASAVPYLRLGIKPEATDDEVKKAFRRLAQKLHPDKVAHLGARAQETAAKAFAEVNLAYEEIRKERGL